MALGAQEQQVFPSMLYMSGGQMCRVSPREGAWVLLFEGCQGVVGSEVVTDFLQTSCVCFADLQPSLNKARVVRLLLKLLSEIAISLLRFVYPLEHY